MTRGLYQLASFLLAAVLAAWLTPRVREAAIRFGIVDRPDGRLKSQKEPVAYLGGLAIYLSFLLALALTVQFSRETLGLLLAGSIVVLIGLVDDLGSLRPWTKLAGQSQSLGPSMRSSSNEAGSSQQTRTRTTTRSIPQ